MAMEMGLASVGVLASSLVLPALWDWTRSLLGSGIRAVHRTVQCVKGIAQAVKISVQNIGKGISKSVKGSLQFLSGMFVCVFVCVDIFWNTLSSWCISLLHAVY